MRHLLSAADLKDSEIHKILKNAASGKFKTAGKKICAGLIFLEPSTRTRSSFQRATQRLGWHSILIEAKGSSLEKGESLEDTLDNLNAMGVRLFAIRTPDTRGLAPLSHYKKAALLNAGDGVGEHPTQVLGDLFTLYQQFGKNLKKFQKIKMGIVGDLARSRVARSWAQMAPRLGMELRLASPSAWKPKDWGQTLHWSDSKKDFLDGLDVVMTLRVKKEYKDASADDSRVYDEFVKNFQLHSQDFSNQWLLDPGPVGWGVSLAPELKNYKRSLILRQVECGMTMRAATLDFLAQLGNIRA